LGIYIVLGRTLKGLRHWLHKGNSIKAFDRKPLSTRLIYWRFRGLAGKAPQAVLVSKDDGDIPRRSIRV
jgi:hypothetical protein